MRAQSSALQGRRGARWQVADSRQSTLVSSGGGYSDAA